MISFLDTWEQDCRAEVWPPRQVGGQVVGPGPQGVKITHEPTQIMAWCTWGRSQHQNKVIAMSMIEAALTHPKFR